MVTSRDGSLLVSSLRSALRSPTRALGLAGALLVSAISLPVPVRAADTSLDKITMTYGQFAKMDPMKVMKAMDPDAKGYVTREEFLKFQEKLFDNIPKQSPDRITAQEWRNQAPSGNAGK
jgi:hypothetical protein